MAKNIKTLLTDEEAFEIIADLCGHLDNEQRILFEQQVLVRHYKKNELIYHEGGTPEYMMCLVDGKVKIFIDGVGGRTQIVRVIKPVEYFGYRAYFARGKYVTSAAAFEHATICLIPMTLIENMIGQNNELALFFIRQLSIDLGVADERTVNLTQKHIRARLAEALIFLKDTCGVEEDGSTLSICPSREELASLSNMTTSNAIRLLASFAAEQYIAIEGRIIKILDEEALARISVLG